MTRPSKTYVVSPTCAVLILAVLAAIPLLGFNSFGLGKNQAPSMPSLNDAEDPQATLQSRASSISIQDCAQCGCNPCKCAIELLEVNQDETRTPLLRLNVAGCLKEVLLPVPGINLAAYPSVPADSGNDPADFPFGFGTDPTGDLWFVDHQGYAKLIEYQPQFTPSLASGFDYNVIDDPGPASPPSNPNDGDEYWETYTNGKLIAVYDSDTPGWSHFFFPTTIHRIHTLDTYPELRAYDGPEKTIIVRDPSGHGFGGVFYLEETSPGLYSENGGTVIQGVAGRIWRRIFKGTRYHPEWWEIGTSAVTIGATTVQTGFDASGTPFDPSNPQLETGIKYPADQIAAAVKAAGPGGRIVLAKGKRYTVHRAIWLEVAQFIEGNSAELFRPDQTILQTHAVATPANQNQMTLVDASSLRVGEEISAVFGDKAEGSSGRLRITAIDGNELTFAQPVQYEIPASTPVVRTHPLLVNSYQPREDTTGLYTGTTIENLVFDGNRDNNTIVKAWNNATSFESANNRVVLQNVGFKNSPTESCTIDKGLLQSCWARDCNGSAVHFIGNSTVFPEEQQLTIIGFTCENVCEATNEVTGHSEAAFTYSDNVQNVKILDSTIKNCAEACFGFSDRNDTVTYLAGINAENTQGIFEHSNSTTDTLVRDLTLVDSNFRNCGDLLIFSTPTYREKFGFDNIKISGNTIVNGRVLLLQCSNVQFTYNRVYVDEDDNYPAWTEGTNPMDGYVTFADCDKLTFSGNRIWGPLANNDVIGNGVVLRPSLTMKDETGDTDYYYMSDVTVANNSVANFRRGIVLDGTNAPHVKEIARICSGWSYNGNRVWLNEGTGTSTAMVGIQVPPGGVCYDCEVYPPRRDVHGQSNNWYGIQAMGVDDSRNETKAIGAQIYGCFVPFKGCRAFLVGTTVADRNQFHVVLKENKYMGAIHAAFPANHHIGADNVDLEPLLPTMTDYTAPPRFNWGVNAADY